jgi:biopolymer transport protein ExbD
MIGKRNPDREAEELQELAPNLTPLIDVVFMLIFFLVLTANAVQFAVDIALPGAAEAERPALAAPHQVIVTLRRDGDIAIDGHAIPDWERAKAILNLRADQDPEAWFVIAGDRHAELQALAPILAFLQERGIRRTRILIHRQGE